MKIEDIASEEGMVECLSCSLGKLSGEGKLAFPSREEITLLLKSPPNVLIPLSGNGVAVPLALS